ncbi:AAA-domain-containing protein [Basidiobolus meristosporus CBS 931.73]|uniref:AAA-domain-containing protein n=1 Tax=Basidiobolus meristosporus CBS 931.73 TaxID=1314790 RepID=A0A1Y1XPB6_9FUNG|nr:AAA-domain-containing protein [Basidiobolus meristosporus CBS 931.73]|eukprot:ORX87174.1 AAA-domain-containing protein [Basidiobolus meristosporus CBS 931.73]
MGFVGRDLTLLCRAAALHAMRKQNTDSVEDNLFNVEELSRFFSRLKLTGAPGESSISRLISWDDFEYALSVTKPSQQVEFESTIPRKYWREIGGYETIIDRLRQLIRISITSVESSHFLGVQPPSGLLLYGPSGCGKTALVNALISESTLNVIIVKGPEIFSKYFGETENTIRRLFATARQIAPCVVFFDEIDALGTKREWNLDESGGGVNERVLSTLLNEMDGVSERKGVFVIGCTNRPDKVDDAILRPGRLDQLLYVGYPELQDRVKILEALARKTPISSALDFSQLAAKTEYFSGADLENVIREGAIHALREDIEAEEICTRHIEPVLQKMKIGVLQRASDPVMLTYKQFQMR